MGPVFFSCYGQIMEDASAAPNSNVPESESTPAWELALMGERFRLKPSRPSNANETDARLASEAIAWVARQIASAETKLGTGSGSRPKPHHVALLAMVELAHEAMQERNRHAQALEGLIQRLENLKKNRAKAAAEKAALAAVVPAPVLPEAVIEQAEKVWLKDDPAEAGAPITPS